MANKIDQDENKKKLTHTSPMDRNYDISVSRTSEESVYGHRGPPENLTMQDSWGNQLAWND